MNKKGHRAAAVIDIGSSVVRMNISQWDGASIVPLDYLEKPIALGQEVFTTGRISFETVRQLSQVLSGFCAVAREYGITRIEATGTTALREAVNRAYVVDHLSVQNHLDVRVLGNAETSALIFHLLFHDAQPDPGSVLMVHGGMGTLDFALSRDGRIAFTQSVPTGFLKIAEMLRETSEFTLTIDRVAEQFLRTFLTRPSRMRDLLDVDEFVFSYGDMQPLLAVCGAQGHTHAVLEKKAVQDAFARFRTLSFEQISLRYGVDLQGAGTLYAVMSLLSSLLGLTRAKRAHCVQANLTDALLDLHLRPGARRAYNETLIEGAIASALDLAARYRCDIAHAQQVASVAQTLFATLHKLHGLSKRQGLLLRIACLMHEVGQYTSAYDVHEASFHLVADAQLFGVQHAEALVIANIIAPEELLGVDSGVMRADRLPEGERLAVAKMHALLVLADVMDFSRRQKAEMLSIELEGNRLLIRLKLREEYTIEQWMFHKKEALFGEAFGIEPVLLLENANRI